MYSVQTQICSQTIVPLVTIGMTNMYDIYSVHNSWVVSWIFPCQPSAYHYDMSGLWWRTLYKSHLSSFCPGLCCLISIFGDLTQDWNIFPLGSFLFPPNGTIVDLFELILWTTVMQQRFTTSRPLWMMSQCHQDYIYKYAPH